MGIMDSMDEFELNLQIAQGEGSLAAVNHGGRLDTHKGLNNNNIHERIPTLGPRIAAEARCPISRLVCTGALGIF